VKHGDWAVELRRQGSELQADQIEMLRGYLDALHARAIPRGFVGAGDAERLWERHIRDSLRALPEISPGSTIVDIGSGAGLPGIPLAIALPSSSVTLVEVRKGRVAFLEAVIDDLALPNVEVFLGRVTEVSATFSVSVARAFSSAAASWAAAQPLLEPGGRLIYWAGTGFQGAELDQEGVSWRVSTPLGLAESGPLVIMGRQ